MPIRRIILLLLSCWYVLSPLFAQEELSPRERFVRSLPTLEQLIAQSAGDYYTPTPLISPSLVRSMAVAPSLSSLILDYYRAGGRDPFARSEPRFLMHLLFPSQQGSSLRLQQFAPPRLSSEVPALQPFTSGSDTWTKASLLAPTARFSQELERYSIANQLGTSIGLYPLPEDETKTLPTLALTRPISHAAERALAHYTQETKTHLLTIPQSGEYTSTLRQRHWIPSLESSIQFSQNQISENWYKGGASNLNLYMRNYFGLRYVTERVLWNNEIESRLSVYNAERDSVHRYRIADDLFRLRSNYGIRAWNKIYYTLDAELRTQLFKSYQENRQRLQSDLFAPYTVNIGLGAKFDYTMKSQKVYGRAFTFAINVAPISYTYRSTRREDIDLARHGLKTDKLWYQRIGSTVRANWQWKVNLNLTWTSRLYFNTSYENVEAEWENTLDMALTRFFSTRFNLNLRYDDGVRPASGWNRYLQYNELLSFGFSYRL